MDDLNATPISKLGSGPPPPMPVDQGGRGGPAAAQGLTKSYAELLKELENPGQAPPPPGAAAGMGMAGGMGMGGAGMAGGMGMAGAGMGLAGMGMAGAPGLAGMAGGVGLAPGLAGMAGGYAGGGYPESDYYPGPGSPRRRHGGGGRKRRVKARAGILETLRRYKSTALVVVVTFLAMWYVAPKLAAAFPRLLTPTGRLNLAGLALVALTVGGSHRLADRYIL